MKWIVSSLEHGWTLSAFIKEKLKGGLSANGIKKAIHAKQCTVNRRIESFATYQVVEGDSIEFTPAEPKSSTSVVPIVFEDAYFAVIDKPAGLVCEEKVFQKALGHPWHLVHRLDKDTSGLLLVAKTDQAKEAAIALFSQRKIEKIYLAIVDGKIEEKEGVIDNCLAKKGQYQGQTLYGEAKEGGLRAITHFRTLQRNKEASLVLCDLKTGRTHQIRVHFAEKGHPLLGDSQYAQKSFRSSHRPRRHLLHSSKLKFIHPFTHKKIELEVPPPRDFEEALNVIFG
jgi:RluA family pseudouridine synthase